VREVPRPFAPRPFGNEPGEIDPSTAAEDAQGVELGGGSRAMRRRLVLVAAGDFSIGCVGRLLTAGGLSVTVEFLQDGLFAGGERVAGPAEKLVGIGVGGEFELEPAAGPHRAVIGQADLLAQADGQGYKHGESSLDDGVVQKGGRLATEGRGGRDGPSPLPGREGMMGPSAHKMIRLAPSCFRAPRLIPCLSDRKRNVDCRVPGGGTGDGRSALMVAVSDWPRWSGSVVGRRRSEEVFDHSG
jgi:hypothetical protein